MTADYEGYSIGAPLGQRRIVTKVRPSRYAMFLLREGEWQFEGFTHYDEFATEFESEYEEGETFVVQMPD